VLLELAVVISAIVGGTTRVQDALSDGYDAVELADLQKEENARKQERQQELLQEALDDINAQRDLLEDNYEYAVQQFDLQRDAIELQASDLHATNELNEAKLDKAFEDNEFAFGQAQDAFARDSDELARLAGNQRQDVNREATAKQIQASASGIRSGSMSDRISDRQAEAISDIDASAGYQQAGLDAQMDAAQYKFDATTELLNATEAHMDTLYQNDLERIAQAKAKLRLDAEQAANVYNWNQEALDRAEDAARSKGEYNIDMLEFQAEGIDLNLEMSIPDDPFAEFLKGAFGGAQTGAQLYDLGSDILEGW